MPSSISRASGWEIDLARETISWFARSAHLIVGLEACWPGIPLQHFLAVVHPIDRPRVSRGVERGRMRIRFRVVLTGGTTRLVVANGVLARNPTGEGSNRIVG